MYYLQKIKSFISLLWRDLKNIWQDASILLKAIVIVAILFISIDLVLYFSKFHNGFSNTQGDWGTFGDFLGGTLNPIFGFFGFLALLATLSLQRKQLDEQRKNMEEQGKAAADAYKLQLQQIEAQRQEAAANQRALDEAHETQQLQQFESTFFILFDKLQTEIRLLKNKTYIYTPPESNEPPRFIGNLRELPERPNSEKLLIDEYIIKWLDSNRFDGLYTNAYTINKQFKNDVLIDTNTYFILLFHILKLIDKADTKDKEYYIELLQDFSSDSIRFLLALDIYIKNTDEETQKSNSTYYKKLVESYNIFDNLKNYMILHNLGYTKFYQELVTFYQASAFEKPQPPTS